MLKHIINKSLILLILTLVPFTSCKKEKICDVDNLVQRVYAGEDVSIFENALNCRVGEDVKNMSAWEINFPKQSYLIGTTYVNYVPGKYPLTYLWFYCDKSDYSKMTFMKIKSHFFSLIFQNIFECCVVFDILKHKRYFFLSFC